MCRAEIAEAAEGPDEEEAMDCGRAVERPAIGSALDEGHSPRAGFLREPQPFGSAGGGCGMPLVWAGEEAMVEVDEVEEMEDEELDRWALLRWGMNILETSSALMAGAALGALHPVLVFGWKFKGGATAVMGSACREDMERAQRGSPSSACRRRGGRAGNWREGASFGGGLDPQGSVGGQGCGAARQALMNRTFWLGSSREVRSVGVLARVQATCDARPFSGLGGWRGRQRAREQKAGGEAAGRTAGAAAQQRRRW